MEQKNLFDRIGGTSAIDQILKKSAEMIMKDPTLGPMQQNIDAARVHENSIVYLTLIFGGPADYKGKSMLDAHKSLDIKNAHFDLSLFYIRKAMNDMNIAQNIIDEAMLVISKTRGEIVSQDSLFKRIGGEATLSKFSDMFAEKLLADPILGPYYAKADNQKIKDLRHKYMAILFGDKAEYNGRTMREAHAAHNLDDSHFDRFLVITKECFMGLNLKEELLAEIMTAMECVRCQVTNKPTLFERIGGFATLDKFMMIFKDKREADPIIAPYFANVDSMKLYAVARNYFAAVMGGPQAYAGKGLRETHTDMKIDDKTMNLFMRLGYEAFLESGVKEAEVYEIMEIFDLARDKIMNRKSILERLGGKDKLCSIVQKFHEKVKLDNILGPMYGKANPDRIVKGYTGYLTYLFGGISEHEGQALKAVHKSLKLTDMHYDIWISIFSQTLQGCQVDADTIKDVEMLFERRRNEVLQRQSLWARMGGSEFMEKLLRKFEDKIMNDATLKPMHQNVDMKKYHANHKDFLAQVFGGYNFYSGKNLCEAHGPLNLKDDHFNLFVKLFQDSLKEMGTKEEMISEAMEMMEMQRNQVLNRHSLYDRLGGEKVMEAFVEKLNHQLSADPVLGPKHQGVDMSKLYLHRKQYFTQLFGGMNVYHGKDMRSAHSDLHLNDEHFNLFLKHFKSALQELNVKDDLAKDIIRHVETMRRDILNQPSLFEKLGGKGGLEQFVNKLNTMMSKDPKMAHFFEKVDMNKYTQDQLHFFLSLFGGESMTQQKKTQETFHEPLPLSDEHFKMFVEHSNEALKQMNVDQGIISEVVKVFEVRRNEVIGQ